MEKLLRELGEKFNLSGKELIIIEELLKEKQSAIELSKKTNIPLGRIYDYLNKLINCKLIERSEKKPYTYSISNLDNNVVDFLRLNFEETVRKQNRIMYLMEHRSKDFDEIATVNSGDDFSFRIIQLIHECRYIRNITRHGSVPFVLYPEKSKDFMRVRSLIIENRPTLAHTTPEMIMMLYKEHNEAYKKGKKMEYIVEKSALDFHLDLIKKKLGKKFHNQMIKEIKERLKLHPNLKIHVINEFIPMHIAQTDRKVFFSIIHQMHTQGLIITNESAVELYNNYFDEMKSRCKDIISMI